MAYTFRGIGAMHYGKRDFRADGSYVTTLWFVALYVPIIPLKSIRMRRTQETKYYSTQRVPVYAAVQEPKLNLAQVSMTYAWFAIEVTLLLVAKLRDSIWPMIPAIVILGIPWILRRRAKERLLMEMERREMGFSASLPE